MQRLDNAGKLVLRLTIGVLLLMHGLYKLIYGIDFIGKVVTDAGWPFWIAYGVLIGEVLAPALIVIGVLTRPAAIVVAINMAVAVYLVHAKDLLMIKSTGAWGIELQALFFFGALTIALLGAGSYSVAGNKGRFN